MEAHESEILAVSFSPASEHLLITGGADKVRFPERDSRQLIQTVHVDSNTSRYTLTLKEIACLRIAH